MAAFTPTQGRYLAFIQAYADLHGYPPAESEIATAMCVSPPSVNQMVKALEKRGLIERRPGPARSLRVIIPDHEIHPYEFQFGKRPFDANGPNYGDSDSRSRKRRPGNARTTDLDALELKPYCAFGYWFDFQANWFHQIQLERIEQAIPAVAYPRVIKRVGKSPPQYRRE